MFFYLEFPISKHKRPFNIRKPPASLSLTLMDKIKVVKVLENMISKFPIVFT